MIGPQNNRFQKVNIVLFLLFVASCSAGKKMPHNCTNVMPLSGIIHTSDKLHETFLSTVFVHMSIGQTVCYDLLVEDEEKKVQTGRRAFISLIDIAQNYKFKSVYNFSVPKYDCECNCQRSTFKYIDPRVLPHHWQFDDEDESCHWNLAAGSGLGDESTGSSDPRTIRYTTTVKTEQCASSVAAICCEFSINHEYSYLAVFLDEPVTTFHLEMGFSDKDGNLIGKSEKISISSVAAEAKTTNGQVRIEEDQFAESTLPSSKWYFMDYGSTVLYAGAPINDLHESSVHKLGWYKFDTDGRLLSVDRDALKKSINASVIQCSRHYVPLKINAVYLKDNTRSNDIKYTEVKDMLNTTVQVNEKRNSVKVGVKPDTSIFLESKFKVSARVLFQYQEVTIHSFRAEILIDHLKNHKLLLFMYEASGWFFVSTKCADFPREKHIVFVTSEIPIDTFKNVTLSSKCECPSEVCLYRKFNKIQQCVNATCIENQSDLMSTTVMISIGVGATLFTTLIISIGLYFVRKKLCCSADISRKTKQPTDLTIETTNSTLIDLSSDLATPTTTSPTKNTDQDSLSSYHLYDELTYEAKLAKETLLPESKEEPSYLQLEED